MIAGPAVTITSEIFGAEASTVNILLDSICCSSALESQFRLS